MLLLKQSDQVPPRIAASKEKSDREAFKFLDAHEFLNNFAGIVSRPGMFMRRNLGLGRRELRKA